MSKDEMDSNLPDQIVMDLADEDPVIWRGHDNDRAFVCALCSGAVGCSNGAACDGHCAATEDIEHDWYCVWRRARELRGTRD